MQPHDEIIKMVKAQTQIKNIGASQAPLLHLNCHQSPKNHLIHPFSLMQGYHSLQHWQATF